MNEDNWSDDEEAMNMRKFRKIKRTKGNRKPKTKKQIEAQRISGKIVMTKNNPMKNPEVARKNAEAQKGRPPKKPFPKGNQLSFLRNPDKLKEAGRIMGLKNVGKRASAKQKEIARIKFIKDNPMKNPEVARKNVESRRRNKNGKKS